MSKINLHYHLSVQGQKKALLAGLPAHQKRTVEIPATEALLEFAEITPEGEANIYAYPSYNPQVGYHTCAGFDAVLTPENGADALLDAMEKMRCIHQQQRAENLEFLKENWNWLVRRAAVSKFATEISGAPSSLWLPHKEKQACLTPEDVAPLGWKEAVSDAVRKIKAKNDSVRREQMNSQQRNLKKKINREQVTTAV